MRSSKYVSRIKIAGSPILPPLVTSSRRLELAKDKEAAKEVEERILIRRAKLAALSSDTGETDSHCSDHNFSTCSSDFSEESLGTAAKLIEYIKNALCDVSDKDVQLLQSKVIEELERQEQFDSLNSESSDTLNNVDSFSQHDEKSLSEFDNNYSPLPSYASPRLSVPNRSLSNTVPTNTPDTGDHDYTPHKLIRSNSYVLDSPTPSVLKFLKSLTQDENSPVESSRNESIKSVSRNLNNIWGEGDCYDQLNESLNVSKSKSESCTSLLASPESVVLGSALNSSPPKYSPKESNEKSVMPLKVVDQNLPKTERKIEITDKILKATVVIQSFTRGFLVRRLLKTNKVIELKNTIKDSLIYALALHTQQNVDTADINLYVRLIRQVTAACYELHSIFFDWSTKDKMMLISQDRIKTQTARVPRIPVPKLERKKSSSGSRSSISSNESRKKKYSDLKSPVPKMTPSPGLKYKPWK